MFVIDGLPNLYWVQHSFFDNHQSITNPSSFFRPLQICNFIKRQKKGNLQSMNDNCVVDKSADKKTLKQYKSFRDHASAMK